MVQLKFFNSQDTKSLFDAALLHWSHSSQIICTQVLDAGTRNVCRAPAGRAATAERGCLSSESVISGIDVGDGDEIKWSDVRCLTIVGIPSCPPSGNIRDDEVCLWFGCGKHRDENDLPMTSYSIIDNVCMDARERVIIIVIIIIIV